LELLIIAYDWILSPPNQCRQTMSVNKKIVTDLVNNNVSFVTTAPVIEKDPVVIRERFMNEVRTRNS